MDRKPEVHDAESKTTGMSSPVKAVITWLIKVDREYRVAQKMVNETHDKP